ncbi:hypothetical protein KY495_19790 [Massilia sp. PAMC28688]|uniref:hypothetical protein n=1 Tax=Massilia sp. PAMC28688 TaxID=2861283 RepID=UPI001C62ECFB|nr:hypothetical protein [Massilia sp. PAMC28688]QYF92930.1 hypothetical protein KY495_19790 [Massilia sp. PAMC28688]
MADHRDSRAQTLPQAAELPFLTLWYRFIFFDWMFCDVQAARDLYQRHAALQHNRYMRRYLPIYLRRWAWLSAIGFALGGLLERHTGAALLSAGCYTWSCVALTGMMVIAVSWVLLARAP